jgi:peptide-methionine (S)-S-oxide reductase
MADETATATVGGGCFWCIEAAFKQLSGVESAVSGYAGGETADPGYREVCSGQTGHAEVVQVTYDPEEFSYADLLEVFFAVHDPTTKDRQGPDVGSQYRSIVLYHDDQQREEAQAFIDELDAAYEDAIVTELQSLSEFYEAEPHHQDYFEKNPNDAYCRANVEPKVKKVRSKFRDRIQA